ncbi:MAG: hypothetical protein PHS60_06565, partial [Zavarzinia sp.]|nr:hypothetical protein [Zavarzinia sp.]
CTAAGISESDAVGRLASSLIGWSPAEAETQEAVATTILLRTTVGERRCPAVILPYVREDGVRLRIAIIHVAGSAVGALSDFERRVLEALRRDGIRTLGEGISGQIEVIMIDAVRQRLGSRWRVVSEKVMTVASTLIRQRLRPGETHARIADTCFVVAFATPDLEEATRRAEAIAADILSHLLGDAETAGGFIVKGGAAPLPDWPASPDGAPPDPQVGPGLDLRIAASRDAWREKTARGIAALIRDAGLETRPVLRRGANSGLYLVDLDHESRINLEALRRAGVFARTHPEVGLLPFALAIDRLYRTVDGDSGTAPILVVPLPLALLQERQGMEQFQALARPLPPGLRRQLILMVTGIARDTPRQRLTDIAQRVAHFCRRVSVAINGLEDGPIAYQDIRPTGLLIQWTDDMAREVARNDEPLRRLIDNAHRHHCLVVAQGRPGTGAPMPPESEFPIDLTIDDPDRAPALE